MNVTPVSPILTRRAPGILARLALALLFSAGFWLSAGAFAADFMVDTNGGAIVVTNITATADALSVSEPTLGNIRFTATGRTFSVNGGPDIAGTSNSLPLAGYGAIIINMEGGTDSVGVSAMTTPLPNFTINGGTGDDTVNLSGNLTFMPGAMLDLDLQNDDPAPGVDTVNVVNGADIRTSGMGSIVVRTSRSVTMSASGSNGALFESVDGNVYIEANMQPAATAGSFNGVNIVNSIVRCTGYGMVTVVGRGGNTGINQNGINVALAGSISGGLAAPMLVQGFGGASTSDNNHGVVVQNAGTSITSLGGDVTVAGIGGSSGTLANFGVVLYTATLSAGGAGTLTVYGTGGPTVGHGANIQGTVTSEAGNVNVIGVGGGASGSTSNNGGVYVAGSGTITAGGMGAVMVQGTGGLGSGGTNRGVALTGATAVVRSSGGNVTVTGTGGGDGGTGVNQIGVSLDTNALLTAGGTASVTVNGTSGPGTGGSCLGVQVTLGAKITSTGGDISVTGVSVATGASTAARGIAVFNTSEITAAGAGSITLNGTGSTSSSGTTSDGVRLILSTGTVGPRLATEGGAINILGVTGTSGSGFAADAGSSVVGGPIVIQANQCVLNTTANPSLLNAGANSITIKPKTAGQQIGIGAADAINRLGLVDAELDCLTASVVTIGSADSGPITISAVVSPASYALLDLQQASSFSATGGFASDITSVAVFESLRVNGAVTINAAATLTATAQGGFVPAVSDSFVILDNVSAAATTGNFAGKAEGAHLALGGVNKAVTYVGGSGNDVAIIPGQPALAMYMGASTAAVDAVSDNTGTQSFGDVLVGSGGSVSKTFTIKNSGSADLAGLLLTSSGHTGDFSVSSLEGSLAPGATQEFTVTFLPTVLGTRNAVIQVASNAADSPFEINLSGTALGPDIVVEQQTPLAPMQSGVSAVSFQNAVVSWSVSEMTFAIRNEGNMDLTDVAVVIEGAAAADFLIVEQPASPVDPEASSVFTVYFYPTVAGTRHATMKISSNDADENPFTIGLTGFGEAPEIAVFIGIDPVPEKAVADNGVPVSFGGVDIGAEGVTKTFTVKNVGTLPLTGLILTKSGDHADDFTFSDLAVSELEPEQTLTFTVTFVPAELELRTAVLQLASNDSDENPFDLHVSGTGTVAPAPKLVIEEPAGNPNLGRSEVLAWGDNSRGQTMVPEGLTDVVSVAGGGNFSVALKADGTVVGWGADHFHNPRPVPEGLSGVVAVAASSSHSLALKNDHSIVSWGSGYQVPYEFQNANATAIAAGDSFSLALTSEGTVLTDLWFADDYHILRDLQNVVAIAAGRYHALALTRDGRVVASGINPDGQLDVPNGLAGVVAVAAGFDHSLALKSDGTVVSWGGFLGESLAPPPTAVDIVAIAAGKGFNLALKRDGQVIGWGYGLMSTMPPVGTTGVVSLSAGDMHALAIKGSASVFGKQWVNAQWEHRVWETKTFAVKNQGNAPLHLSQIRVVGPAAADFVVDTLGLENVLAEETGETSFRVTFIPQCRGERNATLCVISDDPGRSFTIPLSGVGEASAIALEAVPGKYVLAQTLNPIYDLDVVTLPPAQLNSGSSFRDFVIHNAGNQDLVIHDVRWANGGPPFEDSDFSIVEPTIGLTITPGLTGSFRVYFTPTKTGPQQRFLRVVTNDPFVGELEFMVTGESVSPHLILERSDGQVVDPAWGEGFNTIVGMPNKQTYTIRNTGDAELREIQVNLDPEVLEPELREVSVALGDGSEGVSAGGAGVVFENPIPQGGSATFTLWFHPTSRGEKYFEVNIVSNDSERSPLNIPFFGIARAPELHARWAGEDYEFQDIANGGALPFGQVPMTESRMIVLEFGNEGDADLNIAEMWIEGPNADDFWVDDETGIVKPDESSASFLYFFPQSVGMKHATLHVSTGHWDEETFEWVGEEFTYEVSGEGVTLNPVITAVTPASGSTAGGTGLTITGTNFTEPATVTVGGLTATSVVRVNSATLTATAPAHVAGVADVVVTTPAGASTGGDGRFTYVTPPTISITGSPFSFVTGSPVLITPLLGASVTGVSISPPLGNGLSFNPASGVISGTATGTLAVTTYTLTASNSIGSASTTLSLAIQNLPPAVGDSWASHIVPNAAAAGEWVAVASSADGTKLVAARWEGPMWTSSDSGATWTKQMGSDGIYWSALACSADGSQILASRESGDRAGSLHHSSDYGVTWRECYSAGQRNWVGVTSSADGVKLAAVEKDGNVYTSANGGLTWTPRTGAGVSSWTSITSSADGVKLAAASQHNGLWISEDAGATWTQPLDGSPGAFYSITSSADGVYLAAAPGEGGYIWTSTDSGATWTEQEGSDYKGWTDITSSADGSKLAALGDNEVFISTDFGVTWTWSAETGTRAWRGIASSANGDKLAAVAAGDYVWTSADAGATWLAHTGVGDPYWRWIASSADGVKLAAVMLPGLIWTSPDSGETWVPHPSAGTHSWTSIASSADGTKLAACAQSGTIWTSTDSGVTWAERTSGSRNWRSITSSSDGVKLAAVVANGAIYTSDDAGSSWTVRSSAGNRRWESIVSTADGGMLAASALGTGNGSNGFVYTSIDSGASWTERAASNFTRAVVCSADGSRLLALRFATNVMKMSTDWGNTWTDVANFRATAVGAISADGTKMAVTRGGYVYTSTNSGSTFTMRPKAGYRSWNALASSADGSKLAAVSTEHAIWTAPGTGAAAPTFASLSPNTGSAYGGTAVTITGTGFLNNVHSITMDTFEVASFTVISDTEIAVVTLGSFVTIGSPVDVQINGFSGAAQGVAVFTYVVPPLPQLTVEAMEAEGLPIEGVGHNGTVALPPIEMFGQTGRDLVIRNDGDADLTGLEMTIDGPDADLFLVSLDTNSLAPGQGALVTVLFGPAYRGGDFSAALHITSNDPSHPYFTVNLSARVPAPVMVVLDDQGQELGNLATAEFAAEQGQPDAPLTERNSRTFTVRNDGDADLDLYVEVPKFTGFKLDGGDVSGVVAPGESTTFTVIFQPDMPEEVSTRLTIYPDEFGINLTGHILRPQMKVELMTDDGPVDMPEMGLAEFAETAVGETSRLYFTITNLGDGDLRLDEPVIGGFEVSEEFTSDLTAAVIRPYDETGESLTFYIDFAPAVAGPREGGFSAFIMSAAGLSFDFELRGVGFAAGPTIEGISPGAGSTAGGTPVAITGTNFSGVTAVSFGGVAAGSFTIDSETQITATTGSRTAGLVDVVLTSPAGSGTGAGLYTYVTPNAAPSFALPAAPTPITVNTNSGAYSAATFATNIFAGPASESAQVVSFTVTNSNNSLFGVQPAISADGRMTFTPGAAPGNVTVTVIAHDDGGTEYGGVDTSEAQTFDITIQAVPEIAVEQPAGTNVADGGSLAFGPIGLAATSAKTVTIRNTGTADLTGLTLSATGHTAVFTLSALGVTALAPNETTTFTVTFAPTVVGARSAVISLASNDEDENPFEINVSGTGAIIPGTIAFGTATVEIFENAGPAVVPIVRTGGSNGAVSVAFSTVKGTATSPADFTAITNQIVNFADGETAKMVSVNVIADSVITEINETFTVKLTLPTGGATLGTPATATVVISEPDVTAPTVSITAPSANAKVPEGTIAVTGQANDNKGLQKVEVSLNGGAYVEAELTLTNPLTRLFGTWRAPVIPAVGLNTVTARSTDLRGLVSTLVTRSFTYVNLRPLALTVTPPLGGTVTVTPALVGGQAQVGVSYTLKATAKTGYFWNGWTAPGLTPSQASALSFTVAMTEGLTITANFVSNEFRAGSFTGLAQATGATTPKQSNLGLFSGALVTTGKFTGKVNFGGTSTSFVATFDKITGDATGTEAGLAYDLHLDLTGSTDKITGTVTQVASGEVSAVDADRTTFSATDKVPAQYLQSGGTAKFNVVFPSLPTQNGLTNADYPIGDGFGTITLTAAGVASLTGTLADGTAITASAPLSKIFAWPLAAIIKSTATITGMTLGGMVQFDTTQADSDLSATNLQWFRLARAAATPYPSGWPNGIFVNALGAHYNATITVENTLGLATPEGGELVLTGGGLDGDVVKTSFKIAGNVVTKLNDPTKPDLSYTLVVTPTTGAFNGTFTPNWASPVAAKPAFKGMMIQKGGSKGGYGFFLNNGTGAANKQAGGVTLEGKIIATEHAVESLSAKSWTRVAISTDGSKIVVVGQYSMVTSSDSGATWQVRDDSQLWASVASSADGNRLIAGTYQGEVWISSDAGVNWVQSLSGLTHSVEVASSDNGGKLVAAAQGGQIWVSADFGATWSAKVGSKSWMGIASSANGSVLVAGEQAGGIWTSHDSGANWTQSTLTGQHIGHSVAVSADGAKMTATDGWYQVWISNDSGVTWTQAPAEVEGYRAYLSADGTKVTAQTYGKLSTSSNSGVTWTSTPYSNNYRSIAFKPDGKPAVTAEFDGLIYLWY